MASRRYRLPVLFRSRSLPPRQMVKPHQGGRTGKKRDILQEQVAGQGMLRGPVLFEGEKIEPFV